MVTIFPIGNKGVLISSHYFCNYASFLCYKWVKPKLTIGFLMGQIIVTLESKRHVVLRQYNGKVFEHELSLPYNALCLFVETNYESCRDYTARIA